MQIFSLLMQLFVGHIVSSLHLLKERIFFFMCILNLVSFKKNLVYVFLFIPTPFIIPQNCFSQNLFCFSYFYRGRSFFLTFVVLRGSCCSSKGELSLFHIELNCLMFPWFSIFSYPYCVCLLFIELSLSICDKKGEI